VTDLSDVIRSLNLPKPEPLVLPESVRLVAERLGMTVSLTCRAAPEQYEITIGDLAAGYIRTRWGGMSVDYPEAGGECLYEGAVDGFGAFTDHEREAKLLFALGLIAARMMRK
jgi:hypothetical protein